MAPHCAGCMDKVTEPRAAGVNYINVKDPECKWQLGISWFATNLETTVAFWYSVFSVRTNLSGLCEVDKASTMSWHILSGRQPRWSRDEEGWLSWNNVCRGTISTHWCNPAVPMLSSYLISQDRWVIVELLFNSVLVCRDDVAKHAVLFGETPRALGRCINWATWTLSVPAEHEMQCHFKVTIGMTYRLAAHDWY